MNNLWVIFACCIALCILSGMQGPVCGIKNPMEKQNTCTNIIGTVGCMICCGSIIFVLSK